MILYAYDYADPRKQQIGKSLVQQAALQNWAISAQVIAEFCAARLHKFKPAATLEELAATLVHLSVLTFVAPDHSLIQRAAEAHVSYGIHFYDGMIVAAAERAGCTRIFSEDLNAGQTYFGIEVINPFA